MKNHPGIPQKAHIEDILALKKLVDTFSNLADVKDVKSQMDLFTEDAEVISKTANQTFHTKGKKEIEKIFRGLSCLIRYCLSLKWTTNC